MLDTLIHSPNRTRSRYSTFTDATTGLRPANLARMKDSAKISSNRRSIVGNSDQAVLRSPLDVDGAYDSLEPLSKLTMVAHEELTRLYNIVYHAGYELRLRNDNEFVIDHHSNLAARDLIERRSKQNDDSARPVEQQKCERTKRVRSLDAHVLDDQPVQIHSGSSCRAGTSAANCEVSVFEPAGNLIGTLEILSIDPERPVPGRRHDPCFIASCSAVN